MREREGEEGQLILETSTFLLSSPHRLSPSLGSLSLTQLSLTSSPPNRLTLLPNPPLLSSSPLLRPCLPGPVLLAQPPRRLPCPSALVSYPSRPPSRARPSVVVPGGPPPRAPLVLTPLRPPRRSNPPRSARLSATSSDDLASSARSGRLQPSPKWCLAPELSLPRCHAPSCWLVEESLLAWEKKKKVKGSS